MFTAIAIVALTFGATTANLSLNPVWQDDYAQALRRVGVVHKPLAVFVGSAKSGWGDVVRDGTDAAVNRLLAQKFVCVFIDTDSASGKAMATQFEVASRGLIISDKTASSQAYSLSGTLTRAELVQTLEKYSDKDVKATETVVREAPPRPVYYQLPPGYRSGST
jgi:hypothetical protein